jgi:hypothetical protein
MRVDSEVRTEGKDRRMFTHNHLVLFTAKMSVPLTAFTEPIAIFHPGDGKS